MDDTFLWAPDYGYEPERTANHEAGHAVARYLLWGTTGDTSIQRYGDDWGRSESQPLPREYFDNHGFRFPESPLQRRVLKKVMLSVLAGSAGESALLLDRGEASSTREVFESKSDDQKPFWNAARRLWPEPPRRDRGAAHVEFLADRLVAEGRHLIKALASELLVRTDLTATEVAQTIARLDG